MNKFLSLLAAAVFCCAVSASDAQALPEGLSARAARKIARNRVGAKKLSDVCKSVISWRFGQGLIKSEISHHISPGDPRATGYTLVCGSQCPSAFPASFYYSNGNLAGKLGYYGTFSGNGRPRAYCGTGGAPRCYVSSISRTARGLRSGATMYLRLNSRTCVSFNGQPGARNGGV